MDSRAALLGIWTLLWMASAHAQTDTLHICSRPYSIAEAGYSYRKGNFGQVTLPATVQTYSVRSESLQQLGKVSLYGKLGYMQQLGRQQSWNNMTGTYWQGVNLCDSMPGNQRAEQYQLTGAVALPLHLHWWVGAQFDYEVQQTAKDIDPRNRNQWMAWTFTPGTTYRRGNLRMGASLRYASRKESVGIRNMGVHNTYPIFAAYPLGFFKTLPQGEPPNWYYTGYEVGGALQLNVDRASFHLFQQLSADLLRQEVASDRIQNRSEGEMEGWQMRYRGTLHHQLKYIRHEWTWQATISQADSYDPLQQQAVSGPWESYGRVLRSTHRTAEGDFTYRYEQLADNSLYPHFSLLAGVHYRHEERALLFYPTEIAQPIHRFTVHATLTRSFALPQQTLFHLSIGSRYGKGGGTLLNEQRQPNGDTSPDIRLWQNPNLQQQVFDYETASRWAVNATLTYTRPVSQTTLSWFARISADYEQAPRRLYPATREEIIARIGLLF